MYVIYQKSVPRYFSRHISFYKVKNIGTI